MTLRRAVARLGTALVAAVVIGGSPAAITHAGGSVAQRERLPAPGVYRYLMHGNECAGVSFVQLCRSFPSQAQMVISRTASTLTVEFDVSSDHLEASRFSLHNGGRYLDWQRTRLSFGISQDDSAATTPATLALPAALSVGQRWSQRYAIGGLPVMSSNQVVRQASVTTGGRGVTAYEIETTTTTGGAHAGTESDLTWNAPASGLAVRLIIHRRFGGMFPYKMDLDATLLSLTPAR